LTIPLTPPAGPYKARYKDLQKATPLTEYSRLAQFSFATLAVESPPSLRKTLTSTSFSLSSRLTRYLLITGFTYELATVVTVLSYSMISGKTSLLNDTGRSGNSERTTEAAWCSCIGLVNEFMSEIVMASGLRFGMDLSLERRARRRVSSKGRMISPVEDIRPGTSIV